MGGIEGAENRNANVRFTEVESDSPRNAAISPYQTEDGSGENRVHPPGAGIFNLGNCVWGNRMAN